MLPNVAGPRSPLHFGIASEVGFLKELSLWFKTKVLGSSPDSARRCRIRPVCYDVWVRNELSMVTKAVVTKVAWSQSTVENHQHKSSVFQGSLLKLQLSSSLWMIPRSAMP